MMYNNFDLVSNIFKSQYETDFELLDTPQERIEFLQDFVKKNQKNIIELKKGKLPIAVNQTKLSILEDLHEFILDKLASARLQKRVWPTYETPEAQKISTELSSETTPKRKPHTFFIAHQKNMGIPRGKAWINFKSLANESKGEKQIETRLLIHQNKGWLGVPYVWNETGDDARRAVAGRKTPVSWKHFDGSDRAHNFVTPNMNQCKQCHVNREVMAPIGMKAENLNRDVEFVQGTKNQLKHWDDLGLINDVPSDVETGSKFPVWNDPTTGDVLSRARAWLEVNCAHCHNPEGPANVTGLDLSYHQEDPGRFGVYKPPVAAGRGSRGLRFSIEPGKPEKSFLLHRIQSTELGVMMPTLGRKLVDEEGASLIADWIRQIVPDNDAEQRMLNPMDTFRDALIFEDAKLGRNLFYSKYLCVTCHTADQPDGGNIGPKLNGIGSRLQPEAILESIVSPSAKITEGYAPILITYNQDETISGRIVFEDEHTITLALPDGTNLSIDKTKITKRETSDQSPMPSMAGLFTVEEAGALTSFLASLTE